MKNRDEQHILDSLERLSEINPSSESTERALNRARDVLSIKPAPEYSPNRRLVMTMRIAAGIVVLAGITTVATWLMPANIGSSVAFADVQKKLEKVKSASFTIINTTTGKPETTTFIRILDGTRSRVELPNGEVQIVDLQQKQMLRLFTQEKKADLTIGFDPREFRNALEQLRNISKMKSSGELPDKKINGKTAKGFVVEERGQKVNVWVDPDTKLPVRMEMNNESIRIVDGQKKNVHVLEIFTDFVFDKELDEDLFDTTPPADYVVNTIRIPERTPEQLKEDAKRIVIPKVGFGKARFGMTVQEVIQHLGEPEETRDREVADGATKSPNDVKPIVNYQILNYRSRGFSIVISPTEGFRSVDFQAHPKNAPIGRTFRGKTREGIGMESTQEEIIKAYGLPNYDQSNETPDGKTTYTQLGYWDLGLNFTLRDGNLVSISASAPGKKEP